MLPSELRPGTMLICVVTLSPLSGLEDAGDADETGVVVGDACKAKTALRAVSLSLAADDCDTSEEDKCSLSDGVTLGVAVMVGVAEVGVASTPRS